LAQRFTGFWAKNASGLSDEWGFVMTEDRLIALIVAADEPALFFTSLQAAQRSLEAIDVRDGVYPIAYDPQGYVYRISVERDRRFGLERDRVVIHRDAGRSAEPAALRALLENFLKHTGMSVRGDESLMALLQRCQSYVQA
jgi:hypothetical protein